MLVEGFPLWFFETNCWVVAPGEHGPCVIIDAPPEPERILERVSRHDLHPEAVLVTHGHIDHGGGVGRLVEAVPMPVYVHEDDRAWVVDPSPQAQFLPPGSLEFPVPPDLRSVGDGDTLELADLRFTSVHTPGHTPGSTCFLLADPSPLDGDLLFSGDHLFAGSIGRTDTPGGSFEDLARSMREKIMGLPPETRVAPGHGPATTIGRELAVNPFLVEFAYESGSGSPRR